MNGRKAPPKILMTAGCVGGVWTYALDLCAGLALHDVEVTLFVSGGTLSPEMMLPAMGIPNLTIVRNELKLEWMEDSAADVAETNAILRELEAEIRPDIVHVNGYANAAAGFEAPVVVAAHGCVETWWRACRGTSMPSEWAAYRRGMRAGLAAASCVVSPTHAHLQAFIAAHGRPAAARVIHNGRDAYAFGPAARKSAHALACGRFADDAKNLAVLREVASQGVPILVAGDAGESGTDGPQWMTHLGRIEQAAIARQMAEATVFVSPSIYEPFGLAVLEAALSGCALVVSDIETMHELWEGAAMFVDPRDPDAIASAVVPLLANPDLAVRAGHAARRRAERYSIAAMTEGYLSLYADLYEARRREAAA